MKNHFKSLQAGRGLAVLGVLFFHVAMIASERLGYQFAHRLLLPLRIGVDFFFVLSGFVIFYSCRDSFAKPSESSGFVYRRMMRIYPLLVVLTLMKATYLVAFAEGVPDYKKDFGYILRSALLVPQDVLPFISVCWTLSFEMFFYLIFLSVIAFGWPGFYFMGLHALACLGTAIVGAEPLRFPESFFLSPYIIEFYLGCAGAYLYLNHQKISKGAAKAMAGLGLAGIIPGLIYFQSIDNSLGRYSPFLWGPLFMTLILGFVLLERDGSLPVPSWLCYLGHASYSIYLVHTSVQEVFIVLIAKKKGLFIENMSLSLLAVGLVSLGAGLALYHLVEKRLIVWVKQGELLWAARESGTEDVETSIVPRHASTQ